MRLLAALKLISSKLESDHAASFTEQQKYGCKALNVWSCQCLVAEAYKAITKHRHDLDKQAMDKAQVRHASKQPISAVMPTETHYPIKKPRLRSRTVAPVASVPVVSAATWNSVIEAQAKPKSTVSFQRSPEEMRVINNLKMSAFLRPMWDSIPLMTTIDNTTGE